MRGGGTISLAAVAALVGWFFLQKFQLTGFENLQLTPRPAGNATTGPLPVKRTGEAIRIASFNIQVFGESKINQPQAVDLLARICREFDIIAVQEIRSRSDDVIPRFVDAMNAGGRQFDYVVGPRIGRTTSKEQYAYIFDRQSVEIDRRQLYTIDDPDDLLHREPLVGWFRVRGPRADQAFTFSLVNIHVDPDEVKHELGIYDDVFRKVRDDGRREDDVILLGDFNASDRQLGELGVMPGIIAAISGLPTNTRGNAQFDNIVLQRDATREFTGRSGVYDFMREFNLTLEEALVISDHLPVWAEFSVYEGGLPGSIARQPGEMPR